MILRKKELIWSTKVNLKIKEHKSRRSGNNNKIKNRETLMMKIRYIQFIIVVKVLRGIYILRQHEQKHTKYLELRL